MLTGAPISTSAETAVSVPATEPGADARSREQRRRDAARHKKQRQRERAREKALLKAEADAEQAANAAVARERAEERLAPSVLRAPIGDPKTGMILGARVRIVDGRPVRALPMMMDDPIAWRGAKSLALSDREREAARQLQSDWSEVGAGLSVGAIDYLRAGGGGGGGAAPPGHMAMLEQIGARARLDAALTHLGAFAPSVARIVLDCIPVSVWCAEENARRAAVRPPMPPVTDGVAWLRAGLGRLVGFYWAPRPVKVRIRTLAPPREAYQVAVAADPS